MKISVNSFGINNFKSYRNGLINFSPITLIIGPNGAGKTNLLEGIKLAFDVASYSSPSDYPFIQYWGYQNAVTDGDINSNMEFSFDISIDKINIKYISKFNGAGGSLTFLEEIISIENYVELRREGSKISIIYDNKFFESFSTDRSIIDKTLELRSFFLQDGLKDENPEAGMRLVETYEGLDPSISIFTKIIGIDSSFHITSSSSHDGYELFFLSQMKKNVKNNRNMFIPIIVPAVTEVNNEGIPEFPVSPLGVLFSMFGKDNDPSAFISSSGLALGSKPIIFIRHDSIYGMKKPVPLNYQSHGILNGESSLLWLFTQFSESGGKIPESIQSAMEANFPGWQIGFRITADGNIILQIKETDTYGNIRNLTPPSLPDGFFKLLLVLIAIEMKPAILLIDELENSLHNSLIEYIIDSLRDSSITTVITTHSPLVINDVELSEIRILDRDANGTSIRTIEKPGEMKKKLLDLGITPSDLWLYGEIA